jgi:hypothetical protein
MMSAVMGLTELGIMDMDIDIEWKSLVLYDEDEKRWTVIGEKGTGDIA